MIPHASPTDWSYSVPGNITFDDEKGVVRVTLLNDPSRQLDQYRTSALVRGVVDRALEADDVSVDKYGYTIVGMFYQLGGEEIEVEYEYLGLDV